MARDFESSSSDKIQTASIAHGIGTGDFTIAAWVKPETLGVAWIPVVANGSISPGLYQALTSTGDWGFYWSGNRPSGNKLTVGVWQHIVGMRSGTTLRYYENGVQTPTTHVLANSAPNAVFSIGNNGSGTYCDGNIAEVGFWSAALTASEVVSLYAGTRPSHTRRNTLVGYWPLFGGEIAEADWSGNGHAGTTISGTTIVEHPPMGLMDKGFRLPAYTSAAAGGGQEPIQLLMTGVG